MTRNRFTDPETEFTLLKSDRGDHDGCQVGEPTGEVKCDYCGAVAENIDDLSHRPMDDGSVCPNRYAHSLYFWNHAPGVPVPEYDPADHAETPD